MQRSRARSYSYTARQGAAKLIMGLAVVLLVVVGVDLGVRPMLEYRVEYLARRYAFSLINEAMLAELEGWGVPYGELVTVSRGPDGAVTALETDMRAVSLLGARAADSVAQSLAKSERQSITLPVGSLLGNPFTAGRGPDIEIRVIPLGYVETSLGNRFESAGINQTLHRIVLTMRVGIAATLPGVSVETDTALDYAVAETVIVGAVPGSFTVVNGDGGSVIERINDYADN